MSKEEKYITMLKQASALKDPETDEVCTMSNFSALISQHFEHHWVGFYRVTSKETLMLGPFQGPVACTLIGYNKGVCGSAWARKETIIVDDVDQFPGHIACSPYSRSEIVVPCFKGEHIYAVLDIDSSEIAAFDEIDKRYLEQLVALI